jgi:predicted DNA-binding protein (UPF0251 family)
MDESSAFKPATSRNPHGWLLQRLRDDTNQTVVAKGMGVNKSTINRLVNSHAEPLLDVMERAGLRVIDASETTISREELAALRLLAERGLKSVGAPSNASEV